MSASAEASGKMTRRSIDVWKVVYIIILILAVFTRLIWLGDRAVSHDETTHAKYSWNLYSGRGFRHDPLMHGPLLFEATSLFYFLFGVSDFTARLYTALAGIALVVSPVLLRKWLGQWGALIASLLLLISPAITYYSRYTRHDIPIMLMVILFLWSVFSYLEDGKTRWLYIMAGFFALMYASKENAYIYTAIFLFLLALPFLKWLLTTPWSNPNVLKFLIPLLLIALIAGGLFVLSLGNSQVVEAGEGNNDIGGVIVPGWGRLALLLACTSMIVSLLLVVQGVGRDNFINMRLFDVLMVVGTLTLPLGSALMMKFIAGVDMTQFYSGMMALNFNAMAIGSVIGAFAMLFIDDSFIDISGFVVGPSPLARYCDCVLHRFFYTVQLNLYLGMGDDNRVGWWSGLLDRTARCATRKSTLVLLRHCRTDVRISANFLFAFWQPFLPSVGSSDRVQTRRLCQRIPRPGETKSRF